MQLCLHNFTSGAKFNYGRDTWILKHIEFQKHKVHTTDVFFVTKKLKIDYTTKEILTSKGQLKVTNRAHMKKSNDYNKI